MKFTIKEAEGFLTKKIDEMVSAIPSVPGFFRSMFKDNVSNSYAVEFDEEVQIRKVLEDDNMYGPGQTLSLDKATTKLYVPPIYKPNTVYTGYDAYTRVVLDGSVTNSSANYKAFLDKVAKEVVFINRALDRTEELMCANAIQTGVVITKYGDSIDYKYKSSHKLAYDAGRDFSISTVDPEPVFTLMAQTMVIDGKASIGGAIDVLLGEDVMTALTNNPLVQKRLDIKNFELGMIQTGAIRENGTTPRGFVQYGGYTFNLYTYAETYIHPSTGLETKLMNPKAMVMKASNTMLEMFYGGVPAGDDYMPKAGKRQSFIYDNKEAKQKKYQIETRFLAVLKEPNKIVVATILN